MVKDKASRRQKDSISSNPSSALSTNNKIKKDSISSNNYLALSTNNNIKKDSISSNTSSVLQILRKEPAARDSLNTIAFVIILSVM